MRKRGLVCVPHSSLACFLVWTAVSAWAFDGPGVQWREWSAETFAAARRLDRPLLLVIGARWSHSGEVLEREVFGDPKITALLNEIFIPMRVDRERRPDVDLRHQEAVQALGGSVGWPLSVFLTPEGDVIAGGTWHSREDDYIRERPGLHTMLQRVAEAWRERREETRKAARDLEARLRGTPGPSGAPGAIPAAVLSRIIRAMQEALDPVGGGFSRESEGPKFPAPQALEFALIQWARTGDPKTLELVTRTLDGMLQGGIHDQVGGGFHRFALDRYWRVPRFEKLLAVNAEMSALCIRAWQATGRAEYARAAERALRWAVERLYDDERGGFWASQAADAGPADDGGYYTWSVKELEAALTSEKACALASLYYGVEEWGEMAQTAPHRNVLYQAVPLSEAARKCGVDPVAAQELRARADALLREARLRRRAPPIDSAILVDANARMVSALLLAATALDGTPDQARAHQSCALKTLNRLLAVAVDPVLGAAHLIESDGTVAFSCLSSAEAALALACQDAYALTGEARYADAARACLKRLDERFMDPLTGTYGDRAGGVKGAPAALGRLGDSHTPYLDLPMPSVNAMAALAHLRMQALDGKASHAEQAARTLNAFGSLLEKLGAQAAALPLATDALLHGLTLVVVEGKAEDPRTRELLAVARRCWLPHALILCVDSGERALLERLRCPPADPADPPGAHVRIGARYLARASGADRLKELLHAAGKP